MSEEPTEDIGKKYDTRPTIETVLERISALGEEMPGMGGGIILMLA